MMKFHQRNTFQSVQICEKKFGISKLLNYLSLFEFFYFSFISATFIQALFDNRKFFYRVQSQMISLLSST